MINQQGRFHITLQTKPFSFHTYTSITWKRPVFFQVTGPVAVKLGPPGHGPQLLKRSPHLDG